MLTLIKHPPCLKYINQINNEIKLKRKLFPDESQSFFDLNNYLIDDLLVKVDRASMYSSLECRVPLLDHEIIEYTLNINRKLKKHNNIQKYILKELLYDYIPKKLLDRPKWGFSIPLEKWLQNELKYLCEKYLKKDLIEENNIFDYITIQNLIHRFYKGETHLYNKIWSLIILNKFLNK